MVNIDPIISRIMLNINRINTQIKGLDYQTT